MRLGPNHTSSYPPSDPIPAPTFPSTATTTTHETWVTVEALSRHLCGASRPTFFRGVATVVLKLLHIVEPDVALFGRKDLQQLRVIEQMITDLDLAVSIIPGDICREEDGLAMSSRNARLGPEGRRTALGLPRALTLAVEVLKGGGTVEEARGKATEVMTRAGGRVDYLEVVEPRRLSVVKGEVTVGGGFVVLGAMHVGDVRLIDNLEGRREA